MNLIHKATHRDDAIIVPPKGRGGAAYLSLHQMQFLLFAQCHHGGKCVCYHSKTCQASMQPRFLYFLHLFCHVKNQKTKKDLKLGLDLKARCQCPMLLPPGLRWCFPVGGASTGNSSLDVLLVTLHDSTVVRAH